MGCDRCGGPGVGAVSLWGCDRDISVARQTDYLVAWPRALGIERAVLVGHDLGGGVAQITAVRHRDMVEGLVLMNAICYDSWPVPSVKVMGALGSLVSRLPDALFQQVFRLFLLQGHRTPQQAAKAFRTHWPHYAAHGGAEAFIRQVYALTVNDTLAVADQLSSLNLPARLVWGAADQFQTIGYGYRLAYDLRATLDRIEGGKHFVPVVGDDVAPLSKCRHEAVNPNHRELAHRVPVHAIANPGVQHPKHGIIARILLAQHVFYSSILSTVMISSPCLVSSVFSTRISGRSSGIDSIGCFGILTSRGEDKEVVMFRLKIGVPDGTKLVYWLSANYCEGN